MLFKVCLSLPCLASCLHLDRRLGQDGNLAGLPSWGAFAIAPDGPNAPFGGMWDGLGQGIGKTMSPDVAKEVGKGMVEEIKVESDQWLNKVLGRNKEKAATPPPEDLHKQAESSSVSGSLSALGAALAHVFNVIALSMAQFFEKIAKALTSFFLPYEEGTNAQGKHIEKGMEDLYPPEDAPRVEVTKNEPHEGGIEPPTPSRIAPVAAAAPDWKKGLEDALNSAKEKLAKGLENPLAAKKEALEKEALENREHRAEQAKQCQCEFPCWIDDDHSVCFAHCCNKQEEVAVINGEKTSPANPLQTALDGIMKSLKNPAPAAQGAPAAPAVPAAPAIPAAPAVPQIPAAPAAPQATNPFGSLPGFGGAKPSDQQGGNPWGAWAPPKAADTGAKPSDQQAFNPWGAWAPPKAPQQQAAPAAWTAPAWPSAPQVPAQHTAPGQAQAAPAIPDPFKSLSNGLGGLFPQPVAQPGFPQPGARR